MSRSISQIYSEAVAKRNNYLQITEFNSGRSNSKTSVLNIITYVMAAMIFTYETILDVFEVNIAKLIGGRINGTAQYYATMAKYFQFNPNTGDGDELIFNEDTMTIAYRYVNKTRRIITRSAYQYYPDQTGVTIKVCKDNTNSSANEGGGIYAPLSAQELAAFKHYIDDIKFVGAQIHCLSIPGDLVRVNAEITYNNLYITEAQAFENVRNALINYVKSLDYNGYVYYQSVIDAIQSADYIVDVTGEGGEAHAKVFLTKYVEGQKAYVVNDLSDQLYGGRTAYSGYLTFVDETQDESVTTLKVGSGYLKFKKYSED